MNNQSYYHIYKHISRIEDLFSDLLKFLHLEKAYLTVLDHLIAQYYQV